MLLIRRHAALGRSRRLVQFAVCVGSTVRSGEYVVYGSELDNVGNALGTGWMVRGERCERGEGDERDRVRDGSVSG